MKVTYISATGVTTIEDATYVDSSTDGSILTVYHGSVSTNIPSKDLLSIIPAKS